MHEHASALLISDLHLTPSMPLTAQRTATPAADPRQGYWLEEGRQHVSEQRQQPMMRAAAPVAPSAAAPQTEQQPGDDFPRIVRTRLRG